MLLLVNLREDVCSQKATYSFSVVYFPELLYVNCKENSIIFGGKIPANRPVLPAGVAR